MSINKKAMDAACAAYEIAQIEDRSMYTRVKICIEAYEATKTEQPVSSYAGGVSEIHTREPSDSTSCAPDGRVMDVLPTPAPTQQPVELPGDIDHALSCVSNAVKEHSGRCLDRRFLLEIGKAFDMVKTALATKRESVALSGKTLEFAKWVASPEGQESLRKASVEVATMLDKLEEDRRLDPELLRKPMTI